MGNNLKYHLIGPAPPTSPTLSDATVFLNYTGMTAAEPDLILPMEAVHFYTGILHDPPTLFQRSDITLRPFVIPPGRHSVIPEKKVHGLIHTVLKNAFWKGTVAPKIISLLKDKSRGLHVSTMVPVHFSTCNIEGRDVLDDHLVLWISVYPSTTKATACHDANPDILTILSRHGIQDATVHWIEGEVMPLVSLPPMMPVVCDTNPTHWICRALTALMGVPIAADRLPSQDMQGTLGLYFQEGKDRHSNRSTCVMAITNKHVVSANTTTNYQYSGQPGAPKQCICNCGLRRFQQVLDETCALIAKLLGDAKLFAEQIAEVVAKLEAPDYNEDDEEEDKEDMKRKEDLVRAKDNVETLNNFFKLLKSTWIDKLQRIVGHLDWAPKIANDVDSHHFTRDIGVMALEEDKFKKTFKGNYVYLGAYSAFCFYLCLIRNN